jgi:polysaccharide chain length determinant protein (PEP-CTERM system associated)
MERWHLLARQAWAITWRRRWFVVAAIWGVCIAGWIGVFFIPNSYESEARLYVDTDAILTPLLRGLAIDTRTESQLTMMQRTLLSRPNLDKLINITSLNLVAKNTANRQELVQQLAKRIVVTSVGPNLFTITYRDVNPQLAHQVVSSLVNIFMEQATGSNAADMQNAQRFLNEQIAALEVKLRQAEQRRAEFLGKYVDIVPLSTNGGVSHLDSARATVTQLETQLRDTQAKQVALQQEVRMTPPVLTAGAIAGLGSANSVASELAAAEAKLAELRTRDTERNPDVVTAKRLVASLREAARRSPSEPPSRDRGALTLSNPVYERLKLQLIETATTISSLQAQLETARKKVTSMEKLARAAPQVQAQYEDLDRGYGVLQKRYEELLNRREQSSITAAADTGADRVRLRVIDPPQVPVNPVAPNRPLLDFVVLLVGIGSGIGLGFLLLQADQSIQDVGRLRELGVPVLGGISLVASSLRSRRLRYQGLGVVAVLLALILLYGGLALHQGVFHSRGVL